MLRRFLLEEDGATMIEYGLMLSLIAMVCFVAVQAVGVQASTLWADNAAKIDSAIP